jgi:hypothetical protein
VYGQVESVELGMSQCSSCLIEGSLFLDLASNEVLALIQGKSPGSCGSQTRHLFAFMASAIAPCRVCSAVMMTFATMLAVRLPLVR